MTWAVCTLSIYLQWQEKAFPAGVPKSSDFGLAVSSTFVVALALHALLASILSCVNTQSDKVCIERLSARRCYPLFIARTFFGQMLMIFLVAQLVAILPSVDYAFAQRGYLWYIEAGRNFVCIVAVGFSMLAMDAISQNHNIINGVHKSGSGFPAAEL